MNDTDCLPRCGNGVLEAGDVAVGFRPRHGRHQVPDQGGVRPPLGLRALAGVVDQDLRPFGGERERMGPSQAAARAGDDRDFAFEKLHDDLRVFR